MMNIVEGLAAVSQIVKRCLRDEMCEGGLLEVVNTVIPSYRNEALKSATHQALQPACGGSNERNKLDGIYEK